MNSRNHARAFANMVCISLPLWADWNWVIQAILLQYEKLEQIEIQMVFISFTNAAEYIHVFTIMYMHNNVCVNVSCPGLLSFLCLFYF